MLFNTQAFAAFRLPSDASKGALPFRAVAVPLVEFAREYGRATGTKLIWASEQDISGTVTLYIRHALTAEQLTEVFHRVLADNGYAAVDAAAGNGWVIMRQRDARDAALPLYDFAQLPMSNRLVTTVIPLQHADPDGVARTMRSYMPPNSRIIPNVGQVFITDIASNIRKNAEIIAALEVPHARSESPFPPRKRTCPERKLESVTVDKLVVQNLEMPMANAPSPSGSVANTGSSSSKGSKKGGR